MFECTCFVPGCVEWKKKRERKIEVFAVSTLLAHSTHHAL